MMPATGRAPVAPAPSAEDQPGEGTPGSRTSLPSVVGRVAEMIDKVLHPGEVADLRRLSPDDPGGPAFWRIWAGILVPEGQIPDRGEARDRGERRWAAILGAMARLRSLHDFKRPLGRSLAEANVSELRLVRLLRSRDDALLDGIRILAQTLAAKSVPTNPTDIAWLVLTDGTGGAETTRRRIARDYYQVLLAAERPAPAH